MTRPRLTVRRWNGELAEMPPGSYRPATRADGERTATVRCAACRKTFALGPHHNVDLAGQVFPSVTCKCGLHVMLVLG